MSAPVLSVVLVTTGSGDVLRRPLNWLGDQTISRRLEVLVVAPAAGVLDELRSELRPFGWSRVVLDPVESMGGARAAGVRAATAPLVAFGETHAFPDPRWAEELVEAHRKGFAAVAPTMVNANPETVVSRADHLLNFGPWSDAGSGPRDLLPWHNTAYARDVLLPYGDRLSDLLEVEHMLHVDLRRRGHRLALSDGARLEHASFETLGAAVAVQHSGARLFGAVRGAEWGPWRRALYVLASPLFPLLRVRAIIADLRRSGLYSDLPRLVPLIGLLLVVAAVGEASGYVAGPGNAHARRCVLEMDPRIPDERVPTRPGAAGVRRG